MEQRILTEEELYDHIRHCIESYKGDISLMNEAVGLLVVGRVMGWEHQRICSPRSGWTFCTKVFGDPKLLLPKRTAIGQRKSRALHMVDRLTETGELVKGFIDVVQGKYTLDKEEKRQLVDF